MKKIIRMALCLTLAAVLLFTGCVTVSVNNGGSEESETKDLLAQIQERGVIRVGTEGTYPPNTYHDENDELVGFDV